MAGPYTIFGTTNPTSLSPSSLSGPFGYATAFYVLGVTGWQVTGVRIFIPLGSTAPSSAMRAYLWGGSTGASTTPDVELASATFIGWTAGAWNSVSFSSPVTVTSGTKYWAQVWLASGTVPEQSNRFSSGASVASVDGVPIYAAGFSEVSTGQGSFFSGTFGNAPDDNFNASWYGIDVTVAVPSSETADSLPLHDHAVGVRSGLPAAVGASATATDPMGLSGSDTASFAVSGTQTHVVQRSFNQVRITWGTVTNTNVPGPLLVANPDGPLTLGLEFHVQWPCRFIGGKFFKHPSLAGSVPVRLWDHQGVDGAVRELGSETLTLVADTGGWTEFTFSSPIDLTPDVDYILSYYSPNAYFVQSDYIFYWWPEVQTPFVVNNYHDVGGVRTGGSAFHSGTGQVVPDAHVPANYYLDPLIEWDSSDPVYELGEDYYSQWVNGTPSFPFAFAVFYADPQWLQDYMDMGVNTLTAGSATPEYVAAVKASGMDHYPMIGDDPSNLTLRGVQEDPVYAAHVKGYYIIDEPDQYFPYSPPSTIRGWIRNVRLVDSTRPAIIGMGRVTGINATFYHQPQGSNMIVANQLWREWAQLGDIVDGDFYSLADDQDPEGLWGVWMYGVFTERMRTMVEGRMPVWITIESTSQTANQPQPHEVVKATWAALIAGAEAITFFDHRFANATVSQDFAHMLHNPPMKAAVAAMIVRVNTLADALHSPEADLCTGWTSSNQTSGPVGGTYGVPMHYCTKDDGTHEYLFAMGIRPGSTTATFTLPSWAGETVTVLDESRTVVVDGAGVLTDTFAADYTVHLYERTP